MRYLTLGEVAERLERHPERIADAIAFGELPAVWQGSERVIPLSALPPRRQVSEEES